MAGEGRGASAAVVRDRRRFGAYMHSGLSCKLLVLTIMFVMLSEVTIYVPSIVNYRMAWLRDAHATASIAALVLSSDTPVGTQLEGQLLDATGALAIALRDRDRRRLLTLEGVPGHVAVHVDLDRFTVLGAVLDTFDSLTAPRGRLLRITAAMPGSSQIVEAIVPEADLHAAIFAYSRNILVLSLVISVITAALVYSSLRRVTVRPLQRLTAAMDRFAVDPADASRMIQPSGRSDEIGDAEVRLRAMQEELGRTIHQQRHLAELGLAVSKINHDLRNLLASAQLFSDRLAAVPDPLVQRLAPKIVRTLDRAIGYTRSVLAYGAAREAPPERRLVTLACLVDDVAEVVGVAQHSTIVFEADVPRDIEVDADPDQLFRVLVNLARNAVEALEAGPNGALVRRLTIGAERTGAVVRIRVADTGPGVPARAREHLFQAFHCSGRPGGTGLGLAIAAELVRAHGGQIALVAGPPGAVFEITLPDRPVDLAAVRRAAGRASA
jgi:signal transduction histidine kinase